MTSKSVITLLKYNMNIHKESHNVDEMNEGSKEMNVSSKVIPVEVNEVTYHFRIKDVEVVRTRQQLHQRGMGMTTWVL